MLEQPQITAKNNSNTPEQTKQEKGFVAKIKAEKSGNNQNKQSLLSDPVSLAFGAATVMSIGSMLIKGKNGLTYAQSICNKMMENETGFKRQQADLVPNTELSFLGGYQVFILSFAALASVGYVAKKLYELVVDDKHKENVSR